MSKRPADTSPSTSPAATPRDKNFRFYDNRQKYLLFVNTCSEKRAVSERVIMEIEHIQPTPPAVRVFDAGVGDGTVLTRVMRAMHAKFPTRPLYFVGKEISVEDVRLTLEKVADRFFEHPSMVLVLTNVYYSEAPWLAVKSPAAQAGMVWHEMAMTGNSAYEFEQQITGLEPFLNANWKAGVSATGASLYEKPVVLVIYRKDHEFLLEPVIPRRGHARADFDLVMASQPYRSRVSAEAKAKRVIVPLARALGPSGRLIGIHSSGGDPGMDIIEKVWPGDAPFPNTRHDILAQAKQLLGADARDFNFDPYPDYRSTFRYHMHTLPSEVAGSIGTSTLFAAWNAAVYVAQIDDERLSEAVRQQRYLTATDEVLKKYGGLWFNDESYVISRRPA